MTAASIPEQPAGLRVSVIVPVFNGGAQLQQCLGAIAASSCAPDECIVVDDASSDGVAAKLAERHGARLIRLERQRGPAFARNCGAREAVGDILFFCDADVVLDKDALAIAVRVLRERPDVSAIFGSYDDEPDDPSFLSQYRNLFHHWVHQSAGTEAETFWAGCGAIRRDDFVEIGGFDCDYRYPSIEDIEFGGRLVATGHRILLEKRMLGKHLKRWTLWNMVRTDILKRGVPWFRLVLRNRRVPSQLNLSLRARVATALAALLGCSLLVLPLVGQPQALLPTIAFAFTAACCTPLGRARQKGTAIALLTAALIILAPVAVWLMVPNRLALIPLSLCLAIVLSHGPFYSYLARKRGVPFALAAMPAQLLFFLGCAISVVLGLAWHLLPAGGLKKPDREPGAH